MYCLTEFHQPDISYRWLDSFKMQLMYLLVCYQPFPHPEELINLVVFIYLFILKIYFCLKIRILFGMMW